MRIMKTILTLIFAFVLMIGVCEAATAETVNNGAELARMKRLAVAYPDYYQTLEKEPTLNEFMTALFEAGRVARDTYVVSYDSMVNNIKADTGIDIKVLPKAEARRIFKEHVYKYADGYLYATLANNSRLNLFCEVYLPNTNELVYVLRVEGSKSDETKNVKTYKEMAEEFYRAFEKAVQTEEKKIQKGEKDKK